MPEVPFSPDESPDIILELIIPEDMRKAAVGSLCEE